MIVVNLVALATVTYRICKRKFSRFEWILLAIIAINWIMVAAQINICDHKLLPEKRYWAQSSTLAIGWFVWGIMQFSAWLSPKIRAAKWLLPLLAGMLAVNDMAMLAKPHIPVGRRYAYVKACDWAAERIRADWDGPKRDETNLFRNENYHEPNRPCIDAHSNRLPYVLGGRADALVKQSKIDIPDYIFDEDREIDLADKHLRGAKYRLLDKVQFGKYKFSLYRRDTGKSGF